MKSISSNKTTVHELALIIIIIIGVGAKTCLIVVCLIVMVVDGDDVQYVLIQLMYNVRTMI
jgi:hypothetical protein